VANNELSLKNIVGASLIRNRPLEVKSQLKGFWTVEVIRQGKSVFKKDFPNGVTNIGKNSILDIMFDAATQITTWYLSFIDATGFTALAAADTMASHAGWTEFTSYAEATRVLWNPSPAASQIITNPTPAQFNITATGTLKGGFLVSNNVKAGTTGTLWGTALFSGDIPVVNLDVVNITYSVQAS
jgi:hypothetical protein